MGAVSDWLKFVACASITPGLLLLAWAFPIPHGAVEDNCLRWHYTAELHVTIDPIGGSSSLLILNPVCDRERAFGVPSAYTNPSP